MNQRRTRARFLPLPPFCTTCCSSPNAAFLYAPFAEPTSSDDLTVERSPVVVAGIVSDGLRYQFNALVGATLYLSPTYAVGTEAPAVTGASSGESTGDPAPVPAVEALRLHSAHMPAEGVEALTKDIVPVPLSDIVGILARLLAASCE